MKSSILRSAVIALFAAIICATSFFRVPIPGLASGIVIQNAVCIMTAVLLGGIWGACPTALFFLVGVLGLPVFSGGQGGFQVLMNINGGFRIGWVVGALASSLIAGKPSPMEKKVTVKSAVRICIAVFAGMILLYVPEIFYVLAFKAGELGTQGALKLFFTAFFLPFLPVDFIKSIIIIILCLKIRPVTALYLYNGEYENNESSSDK